MQLGIVSDTHSPRHWKAMPDDVKQALNGVDLILHAGDVCTPLVLDELSEIAPVRVVQGNNDGPDVAAWGATERLELELEGVRVEMIHDSGARMGRCARLQRMFPSCDLVIYGHSHIPLDEEWNGFRWFNPGSPTDKRMQPNYTLGRIDVDSGTITSHRIITLDRVRKTP